MDYHVIIVVLILFGGALGVTALKNWLENRGERLAKKDEELFVWPKKYSYPEIKEDFPKTGKNE